MAEVIVDVVSLIVNQLGSGAYDTIMSARDLDSRIKRLLELKTTIEATVLDVKSFDSCTNAQRDMLEKLECALADLDYFLDVKAAKAKQKEIMNGNKFIKEVRLFFSKSNQLVSPFVDAHKLKGIMERFQSISQDQALVRDIISMPFVNNKTQKVSSGSLWSNCQILNEVVVGRDKDRDEIVNMLLDESLSSQALSVVSIVGIGGIGKTTLAKYVYHDKRVESRFDVHLWASTTQDFDVKNVLLKILATFKDHKPTNGDIEVYQMYNIFKEVISGKKFFLVLDNVWDQEMLLQKWVDLKVLLKLGAKGSKVLLTTRNTKVSTIMDCVNPYVLGDLTRENSWFLFRKIAFKQCQDLRFEAIAREIVNMCPNVPLVIRSIGGLLAGKYTVMEWLAFRDDQLTMFSSYGHDIIQTLKLSYDQLDERLKLCVAYFSLFHKGYGFPVDKMKLLWISLGYIMPSYERQSLEDAAQECLMKLVIQGFFNINDHLSLCMHDVMHDLVISIAGVKYKLAKAGEYEIDERVRHLSLFFENESNTEPSMDATFTTLKLKHLQSLLVFDGSYEWSSLCVTKKIVYMFPRLRILSLRNMGLKKVPSSLGELITLRYLDLSDNPMTRLPNSITQLVELLSLDVSNCMELDELPNGIKKLIKLRHFRNSWCPAHIPKEVESLLDLQTLDDFPLKFSEGFPRESDCGLAELKNIINRLVGKMKIYIMGDAICKSFKGKEEKWESKGNLEELKLNFEYKSVKGNEMVIEALQPTTNLRELYISGYKGQRLPRWFKDEIHYFENLVHIWLENFEGCKSHGTFGRLLHLKVLFCYRLRKVEYIEENRSEDNNPNAPLFPSLEELKLEGMPKLKRWYKVSDEGNNNNNNTCTRSLSIQHNNNILLAPKLGFLKVKILYVTNIEFVISMTREFRGFSSLTALGICNCEDLKTISEGDGIPNLSNLEELWLSNCNEELKERCRKPNGEDWPLIKHIPDLRIYSL